MDVNAFGITHVGKQRQHNEDSFLVAAEAKLYLVADGMGGHAAGEIASLIAVDSISEFFLNTKYDDGTRSHSFDAQSTEVESKNSDIYLLCSDDLTGMIPEEEILRVVTENSDIEKACQVLIDTANERGGLDNVTAILVKTK